MHSITVNGDPSSDNGLANKKYIDNSVESTITRFNQTLQNQLKVSVGGDVYDLAKTNTKQVTDATEIKFPNTRSHLLHSRIIICSDVFINKNFRSNWR